VDDYGTRPASRWPYFDPGGRLITIQPWEPKLIKISKKPWQWSGFASAHPPTTERSSAFPYPLTQERRKELSKSAKNTGYESSSRFVRATNETEKDVKLTETSAKAGADTQN